jgi:hypothetical protein
MFNTQTEETVQENYNKFMAYVEQDSRARAAKRIL